MSVRFENIYDVYLTHREKLLAYKENPNKCEWTEKKKQNKIY